MARATGDDGLARGIRGGGLWGGDDDYAGVARKRDEPGGLGRNVGGVHTVSERRHGKGLQSSIFTGTPVFAD